LIVDYAYCQNKDSCIHRRGCKRWVGNYEDEAVKEMQESGRDSYVNDKACVPNYSNVDCMHDFEFLDRFRLSTGEPFGKAVEW